MKFSLKKPDHLINEIMGSSGILDHIRNESGCTDEQYQKRYIEPMYRIASFILEIPASPKHHKEPGGAIRFAIESGFFALRIADSTMFTGNLSAEERREIEPQYRYGTFIAALCSNLHKAASYFDIVTEDGSIWNEFDGSITDWLNKQGVSKYELKWKAKPADTNKQVAMFLAKEIMDSCCSHLNPQTIRDILGSVAPDEIPSGHEPHMTRVVRQSIQTSIDMDIKRSALTFSAPEPMPMPTPELVEQVLPKTLKPEIAETNTAQLPESLNVVEPNLTVVAEPIPIPIPVPVPNPVITTEIIKTVVTIENESNSLDLQNDELFLSLDASVREMFVAIAEDVKAGGAISKKMKWESNGLSLPKDLLGDYGLASSSVVAALKKVNGIRGVNGQRIVIDPKLGTKIMERVNHS